MKSFSLIPHSLTHRNNKAFFWKKVASRNFVRFELQKPDCLSPIQISISKEQITLKNIFLIWFCSEKSINFHILSETQMLRNHYFSFLHPEWNSDVKESLFLVFFVNQSLLSSPRSDSWHRFWYFLCQLIFNRFIEFSHLGVNNSWLI